MPNKLVSFRNVKRVEKNMRVYSIYYPSEKLFGGVVIEFTALYCDVKLDDGDIITYRWIEDHQAWYYNSDTKYATEMLAFEEAYEPIEVIVRK